MACSASLAGEYKWLDERMRMTADNDANSFKANTVNFWCDFAPDEEWIQRKSRPTQAIELDKH